MKIYFLYNSTQIDVDIFDQDKIEDIAYKIFKKKVTDFEIKAYTNLSANNNTLDYCCVIDDKIENNPIRKKRLFSDQLTDLFEEKTGHNLRGIVQIQTGYKFPEAKSESGNNANNSDTENEYDYKKRAEMYKPVEPVYTFDRVILPPVVLERIKESLAIIEYEDKVFNEWGLSVIQPHPSSSLSFYGPPGTGKTMAAEAIADKLHKKILKVSYADIESKFHGEGPKMVKAIFYAAQKENAVLFINEADSLLSKRLTNVTQGSEQAINSMRSQLLICLEEFKGIVIFATNLVVNYDQAFLTRLISVEFVRPDKDCRKKIWDVHIKGNGIKIPLSEDVNTEELAEKYDFVGRDIRKAVISACVATAMDNRDIVCQNNFIKACEKIKDEENKLANAEDHTTLKSKPKKEVPPAVKDAIKNTIKAKEKE